MEVEVQLSFNRAELWKLIEALPDADSELLAKLQRAREPFERRYAIYGGASTIRPTEVK